MKDLRKTQWFWISNLAALFAAFPVLTADTPAASPSDVHISAFDLPPSSLLSPESLAIVAREKAVIAKLAKECPSADSRSKEFIAFRECYESRLYPSLLARFHARYAVKIQPQAFAGIPTEVITPQEGVPAAHREQVLINVHGGGYMHGRRWGGQVESIPIAAVGKFKVVSVDYRMAPEYKFPAASEDVEAVYRELLKTYKPQNIGIYGCSAGGELTAQVVAWLQSKGLPRPGAAGMFCAAGGFWGEGDSGHFAAAMGGRPAEKVVSPKFNLYLDNTDPNDPLAYPVRSPQVVAKFPPSLLIASTRDIGLSSVVYLHSQLIKQGVEADLHVWEGLNHAFFFEPDLAESRDAYDVIVKFFTRYLGS